ncbi:phage tail tube protein [Lactiplantibacillus fabifermentans]|uniref:BIG2 domain-containing protein n=1 Tax=Lactiplantibacillus fabifermentans DSM 21115 TaxID=1413187 RepID=A0A0R2NUM3_9LACO|nr:Ig-like domain-containing protein [Lactiplantibacillus fabifermentans]KRO28466.1 hypothetical protein DY78_GL002365 [Lactiplantibacillus fabifermentans DSM 21115]
MALTQRHSYGYNSKIYIDKSGNTDLEAYYGISAADILAEKFPTGTDMARLGKGITEVTPAAAETVDTESDMLDAGFQKSNVSAKAVTYAVTGNTYIGDPAQDYIRDKFTKLSGELETTAIVIDPDSTIHIFKAVITTPLAWSGAVNATSPLSFTLTVDGMPYVIHTDGSVECQVTGLTLSPESVAVAIGATQQVTAALVPEYASNNAIDWSIEDTTIATISDDGIVTGVAEGTTVLQGFVKSNSSIAATLTITVKAAAA